MSFFKSEHLFQTLLYGLENIKCWKSKVKFNYKIPNVDWYSYKNSLLNAFIFIVPDLISYVFLSKLLLDLNWKFIDNADMLAKTLKYYFFLVWNLMILLVHWSSPVEHWNSLSKIECTVKFFLIYQTSPSNLIKCEWWLYKYLLWCFLYSLKA